MSLTVPGTQVLPVTRVKGPTPKTPWILDVGSLMRLWALMRLG